MNEQAQIFNEIINRRRSVRQFDTTHQLDEGVVARSLERAVLSPNSSNMQLWEFYRIKSDDAKKTLIPICLNQNAAKTASELVVFVSRPDLWKERQQKLLANFKKAMPDKTAKAAKPVYFYYEKLIPGLYDKRFSFLKDIAKHFLLFKNRNKPFAQEIFSKNVPVVAQKSVALAAQTFMLSITAEGYDTCPMEGFDSKLLKRYLKLPKDAEINMVVAVGKGTEKGIYGERYRVPNNEVIFEQ